MSAKISVIMSVYNGEKYLKGCLDSFANQTFKDYEFLIMDDGSVDGTASIIKRYALSDARIKYFYQTNAGMAQALNVLISKSEGEYIARMDVDDLVDPDRLMDQALFLDAHPDVDLVTCGTAYFNKKGRLLFAINPPCRTSVADNAILDGRANTLVHGSVMFRRKSIGIFAMPYRTRFGQDYDLWIRCLANGWKFATVPKVLYFYRKGSVLQEDPIKNAIRDNQRREAVILLKEGKLFHDDYCLKIFAEISEMAKHKRGRIRPLFFIKRRIYAIVGELLCKIRPVWFQAVVYDLIFCRRNSDYLKHSEMVKVSLPI